MASWTVGRLHWPPWRPAKDCEDYAIAKYVALREAGVEAADLRFLLVRDRLAGDHAVLGVRYEGRWLILDNRHWPWATVQHCRISRRCLRWITRA